MDAKKSKTTFLFQALASLCVLAVGGCGGGGGNEGTTSPPASPPAASDPWHAPSCPLVKGSSTLTFTSDGGATRASTETAIAPGERTFGLAALSTPNTLVALTSPDGSNPKIMVSADAGCSWQIGQTLTGHAASDSYMIAAGTDAYAVVDLLVSDATDAQSLYDISASGSASLLLARRWFYGLGVDRSNPRHVRAATLEGTCRASCGSPDIIESMDGGHTWTTLRYGPNRFGEIYFSSANLDHAVAIDPNATGPVVQVTTDGGQQWTASQGLPTGGYPRYLAFSTEGQNVWLLYGSWLDDDINPGDLYLSRDGGANFTRVRRSSAENPLQDATALYAHPSDPEVLYIVEAAASEAPRLYRYDVRLDELQVQSWPLEQGSPWHIAFNPADDRYIHLGLSRDE